MSRSAIFALSALAGALLLFPVAGQADLLYTGINLSGAEFGQTSTLPGVYGSHYTYPTPVEVDYFVGKGMNTFRLPFRWERLQRTLNGPLDAAELGYMDAFINYATAKGANVILDPHNFARYYPDPDNYQSSFQGRIGTVSVPISGFADFWSKVADRYKNNPRVIFNLMNEPNAINTNTWLNAANAAIAAIRATGATNQIQVPGTSFTGAWTWTTSANGTAMLNIVDPGNNYVYDAHQYLDSNGSGTSIEIAGNDPMIGVERLTAMTNWLRTNNRKAFLGEFALGWETFGNNPSQIGDETLVNLLSYIEANSDVWTGWAWWGGGPWWPSSYFFRLAPTPTGNDYPQMAFLQPYYAAVPEPGTAVLAGCGFLWLAIAARARRNRDAM